PLLLAGCGGFACWASGGLETQLFTCLITAGFALEIAGAPAGLASAACFALAAMTRPEGNLFFLLAALHRFARRERRTLAWIGIYGLVYGPYFLWRYLYYGWPFPNTFYVKSSGGAGTWRIGMFYLSRFVRDYGAWFLVPLVVPPVARARRLWV